MVLEPININTINTERLIMDLLGFLFSWSHFLFDITWIGMLYYFNFIQGGYFKTGQRCRFS